MDDDELTRRLAALADAAPLRPAPGRASLVRRRARAVRRRQAGAAAVGLAAAVAVVAPLPSLLRDTPRPLDAAAPPPRVVADFSFPDAGAVAELVALPRDVRAGQEQRFVVRVRSDRGRVAGVDLVYGDGEVDYVDGGARCTPDAGPTTVDLPVTHVWTAPGDVEVRATPQVLRGCRGGLPVADADGTTPATAALRVLP